MYIPPSTTDGIFISLKNHGTWEEDISQIIIKNLEKFKIDTFIDIGANIGYYTLLAKSVGTENCYAFEPNDTNCFLIQKNIELNNFNNCYLHECGLGNEEGYFDFDFRDEKSGHGTFLDGVKKKCQWATVRTAKKKIVKLSNIEIEGDRLAIKMDIEGFESEAIKGMIPLLESRRIKFFIIEMHRTFYGDEIEAQILNTLSQYYDTLFNIEEGKTLDGSFKSKPNYNLLCSNSKEHSQ